MDAHEDTPRIQVLSVSYPGRRRRWTADEKIRIVEESHREGMTLAEVARRHEISRSMLYDWRYRHTLGLLGAPVLTCDVNKVVLPPLAFQVDHDLRLRRLTHINDRFEFQELRGEQFSVSGA